MSAIEKLQLHSKGTISLVKHADRIFSCGVDDSIGIWQKDEDTHELVPDVQNCSNACQGLVDVYDDQIFVAENAVNPITQNKHQVIVKYKRGEFESSPPLLTFSLEITALSVSRNGQFLIAGSNDFVVKCLHLNNPNINYDRYDCEAPIVYVSVDPKCIFFSVSTTDGNVHFRTIEKSASRKPVAQFKACSKFSHITCATSRMQVVWQNNGERVFIPAIGGVLLVYSSNWKQDRILQSSQTIHETFSVAALTDNGNFLASCTLQGTLVVWRTDEFQVIHTRSIKIAPSIITSLIFNLMDDESVVAAYSEGYLGVVKGVLKPYNHSVLAVQSSSTSTVIVEADNRTKSIEKSADGDASSNLRRIDSEGSLSRKSVNNFVPFDDDDDNEVDVGLIKSQYGFNQDGQFVGSVSSTAALNLAQIPALAGTIASTAGSTLPSSFGGDTSQIFLTTANEPCTTLKRMRIPSTFTSGATPIYNGQHYLMWNTVGTIRSFEMNNEKIIEVKFHDASIHPEFNIDNTAENYVFGDLNANVVALASGCSEERKSKLLVRHISAWDDSREWFTQMSNSEEIECISVGREFVAAFTSFRFLRIFTLAGTQRLITSTPCPLITMCAHGSSLVTVRSTGGVVILSKDEYEHQLVADVYEVQVLSSITPIRQRQSIPICVGGESTLEWISFTNAGRLVTMDSGCMVRLFVDAWGVWTPIFIGAELLRDVDSDYLWPIAVLERPEPKFRYVYCKSAKYPSVTKKHVPEAARWQPPILDVESTKSGYELELIVSELIQSMLRDSGKFLPQKTLTNELSRLISEYTKNLMKLFALNFNTGRECRAVELAHLTANIQGIQTMCNFAAKKERATVSEKIAAIGRNRIQAEEKTKQTAIAQAALNANNLLTENFSVGTEVMPSVAETNRIAPDVVRLKRKLYDSADNTKSSTLNPSAAKRPAVSTIRVEEDSDTNAYDCESMSMHVPKTPMSAALNATVDLSQISLDFNTLDSSLLQPANNPFKRTNNTEMDDTWKEGIDFFDYLSKKSTKTALIESTDRKKRQSNGVKNKNQKKLPFGTSSPATKENDEQTGLNQSTPADSQTTIKTPSLDVRTRRTGFDLWSEKHRNELLNGFSGNSADFPKFLVQKFRSLDAAEKKEWNDSAKAIQEE